MYRNDLIDFATEVSEKINLDDIYKMSIEEVCNCLISLGVFKDTNSIKLYLATKPITNIYNAEEVYPISYEKGYDEDSVYDETANLPIYNLTDTTII